MKKEDIQKCRDKVQKMEAYLEKCERLFAEDGYIDTNEQQQIQTMQADIQKVYQRLEELEQEETGDQVDDPITKRIDYELLIELETFINVKVWSKSDLKTILWEKKVELEHEGTPTTVLIPWHSKVEVHTWAKATFIDANLIAPNTHEILQKNFSATLWVDANGKFKVEDQKETIGEHHPKTIKDYGLLLQINYLSGGQEINLQLDGFAAGEQIEESYKNWDTKTIKEARTFKDQIIKTISPSLKFEVEEVAIKPYATKEVFFEKENQTKLSDAEVRKLHLWWEQLPKAVQEQTKAGKTKVEIIGYASNTGGDGYNSVLARERAQVVGEVLSRIIGEKLNGDPISDIALSSAGEVAEGINRKALIIIKN